MSKEITPKTDNYRYFTHRECFAGNSAAVAIGEKYKYTIFDSDRDASHVAARRVYHFTTGNTLAAAEGYVKKGIWIEITRDEVPQYIERSKLLKKIKKI